MITPKEVVQYVKSQANYLGHNQKLIDIFEGNLLPHLLRELKQQLSEQQFSQAIARICAINILPKVIDKLTNIYQTSVIREVVDGKESDVQLLQWYQEKLQINDVMNNANELFNLCKTTLLHPYVDNMTPKLRVVLNDRFLPCSQNYVDPTKPTDVILFAGCKDEKDVYWVYGEDYFYIMLEDETIDYKAMEELMNLEGANPFYPRLPFVYGSESKYRLIPKADTDVIPTVYLVPMMMTDMNLAAMYQAFSILYGIDVDEENMTLGPGVFLRFKSDPTTGNAPQLGQLKPTVDYDQVINLVQTQFAMWLQTKGIRPGAVGALTPDNFASGISKMIDEMDTYEARQKQVTKFMQIEEELWDLILNVMHPYWVSQGMIENTTLWTNGAKVKTSFAVQLPMQSRGQIVRDLKEEYSSGFITRWGAIQKLNPQMTSEEIDKLIMEIDEERNSSYSIQGGEDEPQQQEEPPSQELPQESTQET